MCRNAYKNSNVKRVLQQRGLVKYDLEEKNMIGAINN